MPLLLFLGAGAVNHLHVSLGKGVGWFDEWDKKRKRRVPLKQFQGILAMQGHSWAGELEEDPTSYEKRRTMKAANYNRLKSKWGNKPAGKTSKTEADYREGHKNFNCGECTMFQSPSGCTLVQGKISPNDVCDYFRHK